jgi:hypothetical protein
MWTLRGMFQIARSWRNLPSTRTIYNRDACEEASTDNSTDRPINIK